MATNKSNVFSLQGFKKGLANTHEPHEPSETGQFPKIYRRTGQFKGVGAAAPPQYSFKADPSEWLENSEAVEITRLDPDIDDGWVVVRRHANFDELKGYLNNQMDMLSDEITQISSVHEDDTGLYSITCREPPVDSPDHLLIFVCSMDENPYSIDTIDQPDSYTICFPNGSVSHDIKVLYPFLKDALENM
jgi:hypothetical protein